MSSSKPTTIKELAIDHPYYCNLANYFSNDCGQEYRAWGEFILSEGDAEMDYNLVFRWDIKPHNDDQPELGHYMEIFFMGQRKGLYRYAVINNVFDRDVESILGYLQPRFDHMMQLWAPFTT